jgi:secreted PhoX family phosphatase
MKRMLLGRRRLLKAGLAGLATALPVWGCATRGEASRPLLGFTSVSVSTADAIAVPPGYRAQVLYRWGDPVGIPGSQPGLRFDAANSADEAGPMFLNVQHPGEPASERSNPDAPRAVSNWPDFRPDGRPRSATVAIRRDDGGPIGT